MTPIGGRKESRIGYTWSDWTMGKKTAWVNTPPISREIKKISETWPVKVTKVRITIEKIGTPRPKEKR